MQVNIRKSSKKARKRHGFRAKPASDMPRGKKYKNVKLMLKARRKAKIRRLRAN